MNHATTTRNEVHLPVLSNEVGWLVALGSLIVNLLLVIISARVQSAISEVKVDIEKLRTEMVTLRGDMLERQYAALSNVSKDMRAGFMDRETSMSMHAENRKRLDDIEERQDRMLEMMKDRRRSGGGGVSHET